MKIAVIGAGGFVGSRLVKKLQSEGHEVGAHDRSTGVDLLTGEGVPEALAGAEAVVNTIDAPSFDEDAAPFFRTTTQTLLRAADEARVGKVVLLSIVGIDQVPDVAYYRAKLEQERLVEAGPVPYTIVRATQFMDFVEPIMSWTTSGDTVRLPTTRLQPVAVEDVVGTLAEAAATPPRNGIVNVAGPDVFALDDLGRLTLRVHPDGREVTVDENAGLFGQVPHDAIVAPPDAHLGTTSYEQWLQRSHHA
ncbi:SDR family oxidoreductase [Streptomyces bauhiniae]|uniref:NAD(P)H-binding protein n=1 Tax=Streptomyces bauhiniae TaxID=2340725 RepID=A0A7K3QSG3_9ACTN|nr:NAD(P)H-binding protein [Streptomyces bauhiniae]NEB92848.1 NAD(P)H-binding protein [Streptomyces bauhiniae]